MNIIGLMGHAGAGKNTVGEIIAPGACLAFADKLKQTCMDVLRLDRRYFYDERGKEEEIPGLPGWTGRKITQHIGTEGFRAIDPTVWINYVIYRANLWLTENPNIQLVAVTDARFPNEVEAILGGGGEIWKIERPGCDGTVGIAAHSSEAFIDSIPRSKFGAVIVNDGSLDTLRFRAESALMRFWVSRK